MPPHSFKRPQATGGTAIVPFIAAGAMFMENLDSTVIVTALPALALAFGVSATSASLGISAYLLAVALCIPLSAWLADRFGTRTILSSAILLFTLASVLCGLSTNLWSFVAMRFLQGASAALMTPVARLAVVRNTSKPAMMRAIAIITWPALVAPVLGPPLGGFITTYASWPWIFFINLPIGLVGVWMALRFVPQQVSSNRRPFDTTGFALTASALVGVLGGLDVISGGSRYWFLGGILLVGGLLLGGLALRHARKKADPIVSVTALQAHSFFATTVSGGLLSRIAISATPFLLPLLFQVAFEYSAFASGVLLLAYFVGNIGMKLFTTRIIKTLGFKKVLVGNGMALAASVMACAVLTPASPAALIMVVLLTGGMCRSLQMTALNSLAFADTPPEQMSSANALSSLVQQIAITLGVAMGAFFLNLSQMARGSSVLATQDFQVAFVAVGILGFTAILANLGLPDEVGRAVSGQRATDPPDRP